jgi:hypothetical protein
MGPTKLGFRAARGVPFATRELEERPSGPARHAKRTCLRFSPIVLRPRRALRGIARLLRERGGGRGIGVWPIEPRGAHPRRIARRREGRLRRRRGHLRPLDLPERLLRRARRVPRRDRRAGVRRARWQVLRLHRGGPRRVRARAKGLRKARPDVRRHELRDRVLRDVRRYGRVPARDRRHRLRAGRRLVHRLRRARPSVRQPPPHLQRGSQVRRVELRGLLRR